MAVTHKGFTLIESVFVLFFTVLILSLPSISLKPLMAKQAEHEFIVQVKLAFNRAVHENAVTRDPITIQTDAKQRTITIINPADEHFRQVIKFPAKVYVQSSTYFQFNVPKNSNQIMKPRPDPFSFRFYVKGENYCYEFTSQFRFNLLRFSKKWLPAH